MVQLMVPTTNLHSDEWFKRFNILLHDSRDLNTNDSNPNTKGRKILDINSKELDNQKIVVKVKSM